MSLGRRSSVVPANRGDIEATKVQRSILAGVYFDRGPAHGGVAAVREVEPGRVFGACVTRGMPPCSWST